MVTSLKAYTDQKLRGFLSRVATPDLLAFLKSLEAKDVERLTGLLSPATNKFVQEALPKSTETDVSRALEMLEDVSSEVTSCTFCRIFDGELPGSFAYQDSDIAVIMDLYPVTPGHMLVIPRTHVESLPELDYHVAAKLMNKAQDMGNALKPAGLGIDGFNLFLANGGAAGQDVFHVHLHVIPRYFGDGFGIKHPPGYPQEASRDELDRIANALKQVME